ncbi:MAG TPA: hypothetical protein VFN52_06660 [Acidiferrobacteraceae bacterium]|nr:hypothetical protein [Acidiferrobacteraceae bacterium]
MRPRVLMALMVAFSGPAAAAAPLRLEVGWASAAAPAARQAAGPFLGLRLQDAESLRARLEWEVFRQQAASHQPLPPGLLLQSVTAYGADLIYARQMALSYALHPWIGIGALYQQGRATQRYQTDAQGYLLRELPNDSEKVLAPVLQIEQAMATSLGRVGLGLRLSWVPQTAARCATVFLTWR